MNKYIYNTFPSKENFRKNNFLDIVKYDWIHLLGSLFITTIFLTILLLILQQSFSHRNQAIQQNIQSQTSSHLFLLKSRLEIIENQLNLFQPLVEEITTENSNQIHSATTELLTAASNTPHIKRLAIINSQGKVIMKTGELQVKYTPETWLSSFTITSNEATGSLFFSSLKSDLQDNSQVLAIGLPVIDEKQQFSGAIIAEIDPDSLWAYIKSQQPLSTNNFTWITANGTILGFNKQSNQQLTTDIANKILSKNNPESINYNPASWINQWSDLFSDGVYETTTTFDNKFKVAIVHTLKINKIINQEKLSYFVITIISLFIFALSTWSGYRYRKIHSIYKHNNYAANLQLKVIDNLINNSPVATIIANNQGEIISNNSLSNIFLLDESSKNLIKSWSGTSADFIPDLIHKLKTSYQQQNFYFSLSNSSYKAIFDTVFVNSAEDNLIIVYIYPVEQELKSEQTIRSLKVRLNNLTQANKSFMTITTTAMSESLKTIEDEIDILSAKDQNSEIGSKLGTMKQIIESTKKSLTEITHLAHAEENTESTHTSEIHLKTIADKLTFNAFNNIRFNNIDIDVFIDPNVPDLAILSPRAFESLLYNLLQHVLKKQKDGYVGLKLYCEPSYPNKLFIQILSSNHTLFRHDTTDLIYLIQDEQNITEVVETFGLPLTCFAKAMTSLKAQFSYDTATHSGNSLTIELPISSASTSHLHTKTDDFKNIHVIVLSQNPVRVLKATSLLETFNATVSKCDEIFSALNLIEQIQSQKVQDKQLALIADQRLLAKIYTRSTANLNNIFIDSMPPGPTDMENIVGALWQFLKQGNNVNKTDIVAHDQRSQPQMYNIEALNQPHASNILIAANNPVNRMHLSALLSSLKYTMDLVEDSMGLFEKLRLSQYDLVILDHLADRETALELCHAIRSLPTSEKNIPIIIVTNNASAEYKKLANEAGCTDVLIRPLHSELVQKSIEHSLNSMLPTVQLINSHDLSRSEKDLGTDIIKELVINFIEDSRARLERMQTAIANDDLITIEENATQLIGTSDTVSADAMRNLCQEISRLCSESRLKDVNYKLSDLIKIQNETIHYLSQRYSLKQFIN